MLRLETESGWWLVTHVDHAHLAGAFAEKWGNDLFLAPEPREQVLRGVASHDDGWAARDQQPQITLQGKPSAFSVELVGKYSAFEEIDLADYLAVRERAVRMVAERDPYAALLVSMHTYNLLTARADRTTIQPEQLPLLDPFLARPGAISRGAANTTGHGQAPNSGRGFAVAHRDSLPASASLRQPLAVELRRLPKTRRSASPAASARRWRKPIGGRAPGERHFRLEPYPFAEPSLVFDLPARHVEGKHFDSVEELQQKFYIAAPVQLPVMITR